MFFLASISVSLEFTRIGKTEGENSVEKAEFQSKNDPRLDIIDYLYIDFLENDDGRKDA